MNFLGLDLSLSSTGFYMIRDGKDDISFEIDTRPDDFSSDIERCDYIAKYIVKRMSDDIVSFIAMEDYFTGRMPGSVIKLAALGTIVRMRILESGHSFITFAPSQIKKFETGLGNAPKDNMLKSVFKKHGFDTSSNNIADACAIAYMGKAYYEWQAGKRDGFLKYEEEILKKISKNRLPTGPYMINLDSKIKTKGEKVK